MNYQSIVDTISNAMFSSLLALIKSGETKQPAKNVRQTSRQAPKPLLKTKKPKFSGRLSLSTEIDPAVQRLKAARRADIEAEEAKKREARRERLISMGKEYKEPRVSNKVSNKAPVQKAAPKKRAPNSRVKGLTALSKVYQEEVNQPPSKKLNFKDLMKQAEKVDGQGLAIKLQTKKLEKKEEPRRRGTASDTSKNLTAKQPRNFLGGTGPNAYGQVAHRPENLRLGSSRQDGQRLGSQKPAGSIAGKRPPKAASSQTRPAAPVARPSDKLRKKIENTKKRRRDYEEEEDDYDDDFVVDDEEDYGHGDGGYDRNEIWAMFNRGKERSQFDYGDLSDMEATGADVLDEEEESRRFADMEEKREKQLEKRLQAEKQNRLKKRRH